MLGLGVAASAALVDDLTTIWTSRLTATQVASQLATAITTYVSGATLDSDNFTGTEWTDLTDAGATTLHKHDHGGQDGLADDDHTQYSLASGARAFTGDVVFNGSFSSAGNTFVYAERGTSDQAITASTNTTLVFNSEITDRNGEYNPSTGVFTAAEAGLYLFTFAPHIASSDANTIARVRMWLDATSDDYDVYDSPTIGAAFVVVNGSTLAYMSASDTASVNVFVTKNVGGNAQMTQVTSRISWLSVAKLF